MRPNLQFAVYKTTYEQEPGLSTSLKFVLDKIRYADTETKKYLRANNGWEKLDTAEVLDVKYIEWNTPLILTNASRRVFPGGLMHLQKSNISPEAFDAYKMHLQSFDYVVATWSNDRSTMLECIVRSDEATLSNFDFVSQEIDKEIGVGFDHVDVSETHKYIISHDPGVYCNLLASNFQSKASSLLVKKKQSLQLTLAF